MITYIIDCYELTEETIDGRGPGPSTVCVHTTSLSFAEKWKKKSAWHNYRKLNKTYHIAESEDDWETMVSIKTVERAKAKLSKDELDALIKSIKYETK